MNVYPFDYGHIVSAVLNSMYTNDDVQALTANYIDAKDGDSELTEEKCAEYIAEYSEYQSWRKKTKVAAKEVLEYAEQNDL